MSITIQSTGEPLPGIWHLTRSARDYDEATDMVVIAHTSQEARRLAADECQAEGREPWLSGRRSGQPFARIYRIGTARRNPNGSVPKSRFVVRNGTWSG